eukprot:NODE_13306_length_260_cov_45.360190_g12393_i0.p2 GENE.NODE_13306_length_260_cov_45.360190_g12393_i0~~NODE_13306_length_260_cov_45.360190_g12393_i0.p2  ORF type:complete len:69 (-),score=29.67 NODE_13306_length_260_cov_45.360190_g12393_i0:53-238(-)
MGDKDIKHDGDLTFQVVTDIAKEMEAAGRSMSKSLNGTVKQILGTCSSIGCSVDGQDPRDI